MKFLDVTNTSEETIKWYTIGSSNLFIEKSFFGESFWVTVFQIIFMVFDLFDLIVNSKIKIDDLSAV